MTTTTSKSTKRFSFDIHRNNTAKTAGSNVVTITAGNNDDFYSTPTTTVTMIVPMPTSNWKRSTREDRSTGSSP